LRTRKRVIAYAQQNGTGTMDAYIAKHQRKLKEFIEDALEWETAVADAAAESRSDWELVCAAAESPCPFGDECLYHAAAARFFEAHKDHFSWTRLASALRAVLVRGPSKESRVPFLVGTTNTGKTTIIESFVSLFGHAAVFHLPAQTDNRGGALRNWMREKRFVLWDEYDPVLYAAEGVVPKTQFLKAFNGQRFEIQSNQRFHDGNVDFAWNRGAVFTGKEEGLWRPRGCITPEDVRHMQSRVDIFKCGGRICRRPGGVPQCAHHLAKWVRDGAAQQDAVQALAPALAPVGASRVQGLEALLAAASVPEDVARQLMTEVASLGAIHVAELLEIDWRALPAWAALRELEQRRILASI